MRYNHDGLIAMAPDDFLPEIRFSHYTHIVELLMIPRC
jgi:hypothetical protein